jgi:hypothetical protein
MIKNGINLNGFLLHVPASLRSSVRENKKKSRGETGEFSKVLTPFGTFYQNDGVEKSKIKRNIPSNLYQLKIAFGSIGYVIAGTSEVIGEDRNFF